MKRHTILALFFALSLILTSIPMNVYANKADVEIEEEIDGNDTLSEDDESSDDTSEGNEPNDNTEGEEEITINSGKCGDDLTWTLDEDGTLTISGTGDMYDGQYDAHYNMSIIADDNAIITQIIIEDGVTSIGNVAFTHSYNLKKVSIPESVISIGREAFSGCSALRTIVIPDRVSNIGEGAFENCRSLTTVMIPDGVKNIGNSVFYGCEKLVSCKIPSGINAIPDSMFAYCRNLKQIIIPDGIKEIGVEAFTWCDSLSDVTIPDSVTIIGMDAFNLCSSLLEIDIPQSVISIGESAFSDSGLRHVVLSGNVEKIDKYAFYGCNNLKDIYIYNAKKIEDCCFCSCNELKTVTILDGLEYIGYEAFEFCTNLTTIHLPKTIKKIEYDAFKGISSINDVFFSGTENEWNTLIADSQIELNGNNIKIHYNINGTSDGRIHIGNDTVNILKDGQIYNGTSVIPEFTYTGKEIKPEVRVFFDNTLNGTCTENTDYTVKYTDNINPGRATIKITGVGQYKGTVLVYFNIVGEPSDSSSDDGTNISYATITLNHTSYKYNGKTRKPVVTVTLGEEELIENRDFTIAYSNNKDAGQATVTVTGKGDYTGTKEAHFTINKISQSINIELRDPNNPNIFSGNTVNIVVTGARSDITYQSSNPSVATVDANGTVTGVAEGIAVITVTAVEAQNYLSTSETVSITVHDESSSEEIDPSNPTDEDNDTNDNPPGEDDAKDNPSGEDDTEDNDTNTPAEDSSDNTSSDNNSPDNDNGSDSPSVAPNTVEKVISEAVSNVDKSVITKEYSTDSEKETLASQIQNSSSLQNQIAALEDAYTDKHSIKVIPLESNVSFIDGDDIKVIGVGLSAADGSTVQVKITNADVSVANFSSGYSNVLAFEMDLVENGSVKDGTLDVPVTITLPIPSGVSTTRLRILHKLSNGNTDVIIPNISGGKATFTITHFSTFAFVPIVVLQAVQAGVRLLQAVLVRVQVLPLQAAL